MLESYCYTIKNMVPSGTHYNHEGIKMHTGITTIVLAALAGVATASPFTYQGSLMENGQPANGTYDMTFQLADAAVIGFLLDSDTVNNVQVVDGLFTVEIDFDDDLMNNDSRWIAIVIDGTTLSPRTRLRAIPRAYRAVLADTADSIEAPVFLSATNATLNALATSSTGTALLGSHTSASGSAPGIQGSTNSSSTNAVGVFGRVNTTSAGPFSAGVLGQNNGTGFLGIGVMGTQDGSGWGVYGTTPTGRGVYGESEAGFGMYAQTNSGTGLFAINTDESTIVTLANGTYAINALNDSSDGVGTAIRGSGGRTGIRGEATNGGFGLSLTRTGVQGVAGSANSGADTFYGVNGFGQAPAAGGNRFAYGVYGGAQSGSAISTGYGIYGEAFGPGTRWAGFFAGNVHVQGNLSKLSGSFKIDHPLDPENKYLSHSFVESPDMMNIYNGVIVLDELGNAIVTLPDYFETLNNTFRYQLTAIGASMPNLYISSEVSANEFAIAGGVSGAKVSWEITGVRQDPSALTHRIIVEEDKAENHRGKYLDPIAYGFGDDKAINPRPRHDPMQDPMMASSQTRGD
jgi:hypothetical protein